VPVAVPPTVGSWRKIRIIMRTAGARRSIQLRPPVLHHHSIPCFHTLAFIPPSLPAPLLLQRSHDVPRLEPPAHPNIFDVPPTSDSQKEYHTDPHPVE